MNFLLKKLGKRRIHSLRIWDRLSAERVDHFIANSNTTKARIAKYYQKPSTVIYPMITEKIIKLPKRREHIFSQSVGLFLTKNSI